MFWKSVGVVFDQRGVHPPLSLSLSLRMSVRNQNTQTLSSKVFHGRDQSICKDAHMKVQIQDIQPVQSACDC